MGWRTLWTVEGPVNGLFVAVIDQQQRFLVHGGTKIYEWFPDKAPEVLKQGVTSGRSAAQNMGAGCGYSPGANTWCSTGRR